MKLLGWEVGQDGFHRAELVDKHLRTVGTVGVFGSTDEPPDPGRIWFVADSEGLDIETLEPDDLEAFNRLVTAFDSLAGAPAGVIKEKLQELLARPELRH